MVTAALANFVWASLWFACRAQVPNCVTENSVVNNLSFSCIRPHWACTPELVISKAQVTKTPSEKHYLCISSLGGITQLCIARNPHLQGKKAWDEPHQGSCPSSKAAQTQEKIYRSLPLIAPLLGKWLSKSWHFPLHHQAAITTLVAPLTFCGLCLMVIRARSKQSKTAWSTSTPELSGLNTKGLLKSCRIHCQSQQLLCCCRHLCCPHL